MVEVERKWLTTLDSQGFNKLIVLADATGKSEVVQHIRQGYLLVTKYAEIRMRECKECDSADYRLGIKFGNGYKRLEFEFDMSQKLFFKLLPHSHWFSKTRLQIDGWLIDKFYNHLHGLFLVEREEHVGEEEKPLPQGVVLTREVTGEAFANKNLAKYGIPKCKEDCYER